MSSNAIRDYLGINLTAELPFIDLSQNSTPPSITATNCGNAKEQQTLFQNIIIKLREPKPIETGSDPVMQQAQAIFLIALSAMQKRTTETKKLKEYRAELAAALETHKSNHLYRSHFGAPAKKEIKTQAPQISSSAIETLQDDIETKLASSPRKTAHHSRQSATSGPIEDVDSRLKITQNLMLLARDDGSHFSRVHVKSDLPTRSSSDLSNLFTPLVSASVSRFEKIEEKEEASSPVLHHIDQPHSKKIKTTDVGKRQAALTEQEHLYSAAIKEIDTQVLNNFLIYWREGGTEYPNLIEEPRLQQVMQIVKTLPLDESKTDPEDTLRAAIQCLKDLPEEGQLKPALTNLEKAKLLLILASLPPEKQLHTPLRRLTCQEQVVRLLHTLPQSESKAAQDLVRTLSNIAIANEPKSSYDLSNQAENSDEVNFALITGRFREIICVMLGKLSDEEKQKPILKKWDECVEEIANLTCDEDSPTKCCEAFFRYLFTQAKSDDLSNQLSYLLRASIQDSYVLPGQELSHIFGDKYRASSKDSQPTITYTFGAKGNVQVVTHAKTDFKDKKDTLLFSVIIKNNLSTTLRTLPQWHSDIVFEVLRGNSKDRFLTTSVIFPLIDGGFLATRSI